MKTIELLVYRTNHRKESHTTKICLEIIFIYRMSNKLVADSDYIQLDDISDNTEMSSLLSARNSRRVSDNSTPENSLQQSIDETVERNPCKRIGLSQVGTFIAFSHLTAPLQFVFCSKSNCSFLQYLFSSVFKMTTFVAT